MRHLEIAAAIVILALAPGCAVDLSFEKRDAFPDSVDDTGDGDADADATDTHDADVTDTSDADVTDTSDDDPADTSDDDVWDTIDADVPDTIDTDTADGLDADDCEATEGFVIEYGPARVSGGDGTASVAPSMVWTGSEYGIAWQDSRSGNGDVRIASRAATGALALGDTQVTATASPSMTPTITWGNNRYQMMFVDPIAGSENALEYRNSTVAGVLSATIFETERVDGIDLAGPVMAPGSANIAAAWDSGADILFAKLNWANGHMLGAAITVDDTAGASYGVSMAWTGSIYGLAWTDERDGNREIYFAITDGDTVTVPGSRLTNDASSSSSPAVAWNGLSFAVAWMDSRGGSPAAWACLLGPDGVKAGAEVQVTDTANEVADPSLAWNGSVLCLAWAESILGEWHVMFATLDAALAPDAPAIQVSSAGGDGTAPVLVAAGSRLGLAWQDDATGADEITFAILGPGSCP